MENKNNPLICDPVEGICGVPESPGFSEAVMQIQEKPIQVIYFTDPICSSCWGIEPQLRKLSLEYGNSIKMDYRMGGLLPDWSYNSGGISSPSDVAHHWDEVSLYYDMPIDGDLWLEDPLHSSFPPSVAFKAAQMQDQEKALLFLREIREMVFLQKKNITRWEHVLVAAEKAGLDTGQLQTDFNGNARQLFEEDLKLAKSFGVRGFPTLFFLNDSGKREIVYGSKPYAYFEMAVHKILPQAAKSEYGKNWESLFARYRSLTAREFSELSDTPRAESELLLNEFTATGRLEKLTIKNGAVWSLR